MTKIYNNFEARNVNTPGIIVPLHGGLGNQLFIYAAALSLKHKFNAPVFLSSINRRGNMSNIHSKRDYRDIFKGLEKMEQRDVRFLPAYQFSFSNEKNLYGFYDENEIPVETTNYIYIRDHYFQNYENVWNSISEVRETILPQIEWTTNIDSRSSAFIHVRRGDFLTADKGARLLPIEYYNTGLEILNKINQIQTLYIISDDIDWCKNHPWKTTKNLVFVDDPDELRVLYLMSQCKAGAILSNSTFSCWGAFFGANDSLGTVIYPISDTFLTSLPDSWVGINTK